ncbi:hypothetical protein N656DRAFT_452244 [Canariomyces notabilis]|uniref:NACHT domain-containing protein n=1 Tax=Canariomyces notabilis TaxID=2074819 RepID=A0AAN6QIU2_9PEZI|nr:hypothetical protein N656DRAFT_452244 [Canariomyces arenarius]
MESSLDDRFRQSLRRISAVVFCGCHHRGSDAASWGLLASKLIALALADSNSKLLSDLEVDSAILDLIHDDFLKTLSRAPSPIRIHSFQESRPLTGIKGLNSKIVDTYSSKVGWPEEICETIDADHREMVREPGVKDISNVLRDLENGTKKKAEPIPYIGAAQGAESCEDAYEPYDHVDDFFLFDYRSIVDHVPQRFPDSCSWILQEAAFLQWSRRNGGGLFWLHGYPGQGKSVLAKYLVEEVLPQMDNPGFGNAGLLRSLIHQLLSQLPHTARLRGTMRMRHTMLKHPPKPEEALSHLWSIYQDLVTQESLRSEKILGLDSIQRRVTRYLYLVIDALDELDESDRTLFLERFCAVLRVGRRSSSYLPKIIITSRDDPDIATYMRQSGACSLNLDTAQGNEADHAKFVKETVCTYGEDNHFGDALTQTIVSELLVRANGMFLWASLAWAYFIDGVGIWTEIMLRERLQVLQLLPPGMEALYQRILDKVEPKYRHDLLHSLQLIVSATRPLYVNEIAIALALRDRPQRLCDIDARLNMHAFFRRACPHLIRVDDTGTISLVHLSCKDYLTSVRMVNNKLNTFHIDMAAANFDFGLDCLLYVSLDDFANSELGQACAQNKFLRYAYLHWYQHLKDRGDRVQEIWWYFARLFDHHMRCFRWYDNRDIVLDLWDHGLDCLFEPAATPPVRLDLNVTNERGDHFIRIVVAEIRRFPLNRVQFLTGLGLDINGRTRFGQTLLHRCIQEW